MTNEEAKNMDLENYAVIECDEESDVMNMIFDILVGNVSL